MINIPSPQDMARESQMVINRRELERRSLDIVRIYNPLEQPFSYMHDGRWHRVDAKSTKDVTRFLAAHYFKYISKRIIGDQQKKEGEELLELRKKQFGKSFLDKYEENREVWDKVPRLDDQNLLQQIYETVILGVVEEYGTNVPNEVEAQGQKPLDFRTPSDQLFYSQPDKRLSVAEITNDR